MYADEDRRRLLESRHDLGAIEDPAKLTPLPAYQQALSLSRDELGAARAGLKTQAAALSLDKSETDAARATLQEEIGAAIRRYVFTRNKVQDALLNVDPATPITATELARRTRLFDKVFAQTGSELERLSQRKAIESMGSVVQALGDEADLKGLGLKAPLEATHVAAETAASNLDRELKEDDVALAALREAREAHDRAADGHALLVESVLVRSGRKAELGDYVLAKDAAYAARRAAKAPIGEEEGVDAVDAEVKEAAPTGT
jgi:hypothetical protein